jgi:hypothetical protein
MNWALLTDTDRLELQETFSLLRRLVDYDWSEEDDDVQELIRDLIFQVRVHDLQCTECGASL